MIGESLRRSALLSTLVAMALPGLPACSGGPAADLAIEALPAVTPSLPNVPTIPPPPYPVQHPDGSYSVFGARRRRATTINTDLQITGYIVEIYVPPECPRGRTCPPPTAPHMWVADARGATTDRMLVVGYAENHEAMEEAIANARRGREQPPESESGIMPIPTDFAVGNKVRLRGRFAYISGASFNDSMGLLEYRGHETLEAVPAEE